jgi:hypothetical protein
MRGPDRDLAWISPDRKRVCGRFAGVEGTAASDDDWID